MTRLHADPGVGEGVPDEAARAGGDRGGAVGPGQVDGVPAAAGSAGDGEAAPAPPGDAVAAGVFGPSVAGWMVLVALGAIGATAVQMVGGFTDRGFFAFMLAVAVCGRAAWTDAATRLIPNSLTYPAILLGLAVSGLGALLSATGPDAAAVWLGVPGVESSLLGLGVCAAIGIPSFLIGGLGGGDVKLLGAMGAMLGLTPAWAGGVGIGPVLFNTLVVAAVVGLVNVAVSGHLVRRLQVMASAMLVTVVTRKPLNPYPFRTSEAPFGVALLIGLVMSAFPVLRLHQYVLELL